MSKKFQVAACVAIALCLIMAPVAFCAQAPIKDTAVKNFSAKTAAYPVNVVKKATENVAKTGKQGADIVVKTTKKGMDVVAGEVENVGALPKEPHKIKDVLVDPITGSAEMTGTTAKESLEMTGEAAKDVVMLPVDAAKE